MLTDGVRSGDVPHEPPTLDAVRESAFIMPRRLIEHAGIGVERSAPNRPMRADRGGPGLPQVIEGQ